MLISRSSIPHGIEWLTAVAVEFVDKGDVRHVAQPADLEGLAGLFLGALMGPLGKDILTG
jgi:hypothetical protein